MTKPGFAVEESAKKPTVWLSLTLCSCVSASASAAAGTTFVMRGLRRRDRGIVRRRGRAVAIELAFIRAIQVPGQVHPRARGLLGGEAGQERRRGRGRVVAQSSLARALGLHGGTRPAQAEPHEMQQGMHVRRAAARRSSSHSCSAAARAAASAVARAASAVARAASASRAASEAASLLNNSLRTSASKACTVAPDESPPVAALPPAAGGSCRDGVEGPPVERLLGRLGDPESPASASAGDGAPPEACVARASRVSQCAQKSVRQRRSLGDSPQSRCPERADVPGRPWSTRADQRARRRCSVRTRRVGCTLGRLVQGFPSKAHCCPAPPLPPQWLACGSTALPACSAAQRSGESAWCGWPCHGCSGGRLLRVAPLRRRPPPPASPAHRLPPPDPTGSRRATAQAVPRGFAHHRGPESGARCLVPAF